MIKNIVSGGDKNGLLDGLEDWFKDAQLYPKKHKGKDDTW